jgi:hypothetical protein
MPSELTRRQSLLILTFSVETVTSAWASETLSSGTTSSAFITSDSPVKSSKLGARLKIDSYHGPKWKRPPVSLSHGKAGATQARLSFRANQA